MRKVITGLEMCLKLWKHIYTPTLEYIYFYFWSCYYKTNLVLPPPISIIILANRKCTIMVPVLKNLKTTFQPGRDVWKLNFHAGFPPSKTCGTLACNKVQMIYCGILLIQGHLEIISAHVSYIRRSCWKVWVICWYLLFR